MKRITALILAMAVMCMGLTALADVAVENDQISAYMDSTGGIILTGYEERINASDAYELVAIDAGRVSYLTENAAGSYDLMYADFATGTEVMLVSGVELACGFDGAGFYYVPAGEKGSVYYITYAGIQTEVYSSEEEVKYLQQSHHGLIIGFEFTAGAMVYDDTFGLVSAFNGLVGPERRVVNGTADLVLTPEGALYLDDAAVSFPSLISAGVEQFEYINGYIYYIRVSETERTLVQYSPDTLSWQYVDMTYGGSPISLTTSYTQALVMDDAGVVYTIDDASCTISAFANITAPEGVAIEDVFISGVSGQLNVYSSVTEEPEYVLAFNFNYSDSDSFIDPDATEEQKAVITLLASCVLDTELNTFKVLTPARLYDTLSYGSRGDAVMELQQVLTDLGYLNDKVDGIYGPRTQYAVMLFQDFNGLPVTGIADKATQEALFDADVPPLYDPYRQISYGARGMRVTAMQERLRHLGYMADPADGIYGPYTRAGVKLFQQENGLNATGVADRNTLIRLYEPIAPRCSSYFEMNYGDSGWRVQQMNTRLKQLYYLEGTAGSYYGADTRAAVKRFQRDNGLNQTGVASAYMQELLFSNRAREYSGYITLRRGDESDRVYELQKRLQKLGYYEGGLDGYYGKLTQAAVRDFQRTAGLEVTGVATVATQEKLFSKGAPAKPRIAEITTPVLSVSNVMVEVAPGTFRVEDTVISVSWKVEGRLEASYYEILDSENRLITSGYTDKTSIQLDISKFTSRETFRVNVYAIPEHGTMDHAKSATVYIQIPERAEPTPEPTPVPTPEPLVTIEPTPTPEATAEPIPEVAAPVISVSGDYTLEGNTHILGGQGAVFSWTEEQGTAYDVTVTDDMGNTVFTPSLVSGGSVELSMNDLAPDTDYYLVVYAYPEGMTAAAGKSVRVMIRAGEDQPDPTEEPVAPVIQLTVTVSGADKVSDVWQIGDTPITVSWTASGDVIDYDIELIDPNGFELSAVRNTTYSSIEISSDYVVADRVYGLRITANGSQSSADETVYITLKPAPVETVETVEEQPTEEPTAEPTAEPTSEPTMEPTMEPTEEPTMEPTEEPTMEPTEEPIEEPAPQMVVTVDNAAEVNGVHMIPEDTPAVINWSNTGDATLYSLVMADDAGNVLQQVDNTEYTSMTLDSRAMEAGRVYYIHFTAHASTGDIQTTVGFARAVADAVPTAEPTAEPAAELTAPYVTANCEAYDGVYYVNQDGLSLAWSAEGPLQCYNLYLYDGEGSLIQTAEGVGYTELYFAYDNLAEGVVYGLAIVAVPADGAQEAKETKVWFAKAVTESSGETDVTPEPEITPEPEVTSEPEVTPEAEETVETEVTPEPVYSVEAPVVTVIGDAEFDGYAHNFDGDIAVSWYAEGDVAYYNVYLYDAAGSLAASLTEQPAGEVAIAAASLTEGEYYALRVVAVPLNGTEETGAYSEVILMRNVAAPVIGTVSQPVISFDSPSDFDGSTYWTFERDVKLSWYAEGDVASYSILLTDADGSVINSAAGVTETSLTLSEAALTDGVVYTLRVTAVPVNGAEADGEYAEIVFSRMFPQVNYYVEAPVISISGEPEFDGAIYWITDRSITFSWYAEGDVESYNVYLLDNNLNVLNTATGVTETSLTLSEGAIADDAVYGLKVVAIPVGGSEETGESTLVQFTRVAPAVEYSVSAPVISAEGYTFGSGGDYVFVDQLHVSWYAEGDLDHYNIYLYDAGGYLVNSATDTTYDNMTIDAANLTPGAIYLLYVEAVPVGGQNGSGETDFITLIVEIPVQSEPEYEEPEYEEPEYEEPEYEEPAQTGELTWNEPLDAGSDSEHIAAFQHMLAGYGWLIVIPAGESYDGDMMIPVATEGVFDEGTIYATWNMQFYINELLTANDPGSGVLELINMESNDPYVGLDTLSLLMDTDDFYPEFMNPYSEF